jgi:hypothetical protein
MFRLDVLQYQWLILTLVGGTALVLIFLLAYVAAWRARDARGAAPAEESSGAAASSGSPVPRGHVARSLGLRVPWVVIVLILMLAIYAIVYVTLAVMNPPNV